MPKTALAALACLLAESAFAQWSEPVMLGDSCIPWLGNLALVPGRADTVWAVWGRRAQDYHYFLVARRFAGDSWGAMERLTPDSSGLAYPAGILDDSGRVLVAYYNGDYPVSGLSGQDSWGIYTVTRTDTGWTRPQMAHEMMSWGFPFDIRLGHDRQGGIGMVWEEGWGGMHHTGSVMFSRRTAQGWTARRCFATGCSTSYGGASLIPGDTTDFYLAFSGTRLQPPCACTARVWTLDDTLVSSPTSFVGGAAPLARTRERRHLVLGRGDTLFSSVNRGSGWETPVVVGTRPGYGVFTLAADSLRFAWMAWTDSSGQAVLASYHAGNFWSRPETVALCQDGGNPQIAADEYGRIHCCWLAAGTGGLASVRWAYRLTRPGVEETMNDERRMMNVGPSIVRGVLFLPSSGLGHNPSSENGIGLCPAPCLLDATGRKVMELAPGPNDVSRLAPGVYFVHESSAVGRRPSAVRKVVVTR